MVATERVSDRIGRPVMSDLNQINGGAISSVVQSSIIISLPLLPKIECCYPPILLVQVNRGEQSSLNFPQGGRVYVKCGE